MSMSISLRGLLAAAMLISAAPTGCIPQVSSKTPEEFAREYPTRVQAAFDTIAVPRLLQALTKEEREELGALTVEVVQSLDPLRIGLEQKAANSSRLIVSVGYLIIQDILIDASVLSVLAAEDEALLAYAIDVTRLALPTNTRPRSLPPKPFWQVLGWNESRYESVREDLTYKELDAQVRVQTLAWIVAHAIAERLSGTQVQPGKPTATDGEAGVLARTADLLVSAGFAPVPALGSSVFYFGTQYPKEELTGAWLCSARQVLDAAINQGQRDYQSATSARRATLKAILAEWRRVAEMLTGRGRC